MQQTNRIKEFRKSLGFSQSLFAEKADIGLSTLQRYESTSFRGRIDIETQERIAQVLGQERSIIFPKPTAHGEAISRRDTIKGAVGAVGAIGATSLFPMMPVKPHTNKKLPAQHIQLLIEDNQATWHLLDSAQKGATTDYVAAQAYGRIVSLSRLAQTTPDSQKKTIQVLLGDAHILLGRLMRNRQNYGTAEEHYLTAIDIATEIGSADLEAAARHRYGSMLLLDQARLSLALQNADALLAVAKHASFPLWAEAQLIAGEAMAYVGRYTEAQRLAYQARNKAGNDPEIYVGMITNPRAVYDDHRLIIAMAAQKYHDAYQASIDALETLSHEQGDNLQWQVDIEAMQAHALWAIGDLEGAVAIASQCLRGSQQIESAIGPGRLNALYIQMVQAGQSKQAKVREFGEMLLTS